jgi:hypothetical protein
MRPGPHDEMAPWRSVEAIAADRHLRRRRPRRAQKRPADGTSHPFAEKIYILKSKNNLR